MAGLPTFHNGWGGVIQALGLNPWHEFPVDFLGKDLNLAKAADDLSYNPVTPGLVEHIELLIINDLANERADITDILSAYAPDFVSVNAQCPSYQSSLKDLVEHAVYTNWTLRGNARHAVRSVFMDTEVFRVNQSFDSASDSFCDLLANDIDLPGDNASPIADTCSQGQTPSSNSQLTAGSPICLPTISERRQRQMHLYVTDDNVGKTLEIDLVHGSGNGDLLHRAGSRPNSSNFDAISNTSETKETIVVQAVQRGWNYIHVRAETELSGATLALRFIE